MSLTNLLVPSYSQMLRALSGWLDKTQKQIPAAEAEALLSERLAPDMYPLSSQIRFVCLQAQEAVFRLGAFSSEVDTGSRQENALKQKVGEPPPEALEQLALEGRNAGEQPGSIADARARIDETLSLLGALETDALDAGAQRSITLELPTGMIFDMTGEQYARDWALPQFHFHLITAYAILRSRKIELGKADYVPHMFAYLRPGSVPQS